MDWQATALPKHWGLFCPSCQFLDCKESLQFESQNWSWFAQFAQLFGCCCIWTYDIFSCCSTLLCQPDIKMAGKISSHIPQSEGAQVPNRKPAPIRHALTPPRHQIDPTGPDKHHKQYRYTAGQEETDRICLSLPEHKCHWEQWQLFPNKQACTNQASLITLYPYCKA